MAKKKHPEVNLTKNIEYFSVEKWKLLIYDIKGEIAVCVWDFLLLQGSQVSQIHVGIICNPDQNFSWNYRGNQQTHCQMHMEESENRKR